VVTEGLPHQQPHDQHEDDGVEEKSSEVRTAILRGDGHAERAGDAVHRTEKEWRGDEQEKQTCNDRDDPLVLGCVGFVTLLLRSHAGVLVFPRTYYTRQKKPDEKRGSHAFHISLEPFLIFQVIQPHWHSLEVSSHHHVLGTFAVSDVRVEGQHKLRVLLQHLPVADGTGCAAELLPQILCDRVLFSVQTQLLRNLSGDGVNAFTGTVDDSTARWEILQRSGHDAPKRVRRIPVPADDNRDRWTVPLDLRVLPSSLWSGLTRMMFSSEVHQPVPVDGYLCRVAVVPHQKASCKGPRPPVSAETVHKTQNFPSRTRR